MKGRIFLGLAVMMGIGALATAFWFGITADLKRQRNERAREVALFERANAACGKDGLPLSVKTHGSSWNYGPWIEVKCWRSDPDGPFDSTYVVVVR